MANKENAGKKYFCDEHKLQCIKIARVCDRVNKCEEEIGFFMKTRTILAILSLVAASFLSMGSYSVYINKMAIDGSQRRHSAQQRSIEHVVSAQHKIDLNITKMDGVLHEVQADVEELKKDVRELRN